MYPVISNIFCAVSDFRQKTHSTPYVTVNANILSTNIAPVTFVYFDFHVLTSFTFRMFVPSIKTTNRMC